MRHASEKSAKGQDHLIFRMVIESYAVARQVAATP